jgi:hypothetical protein
MLNAIREVESSFHLASDPSLNAVKQSLQDIGRRVNQCLDPQPYGPDHPLWSWGPEFLTEAHTLWQAIKAVPRSEPGYAAWAEQEVVAPLPPVATTGSASASASSTSAPTPIEPGASTAQSEPLRQPPAMLNDEFLEFTVKQRKLLKALQHKGAVPIATVKKAVYGTSHAENSALERLKTRTNLALVRRNFALEIKRQSNTYSLLPL